MSYQAMGAVQLRSRYREDTPDNFAPYKILMALAWFADGNGRVGQPGDFRKCPGQRAIADRAGVSKTTVNKWLGLMVEAGELSIVESGGSGRGTWSVYQIELEMDDPTPGTLPETTYQTTRENETNELGTLIERMYQLTERTYQLMYQQAQRTYQQNVPNVPSPLEAEAPDPMILFDPDDPDDPGGTPKPPTPPDPFGFRPSPKQDLPEHEGPADKRAKAIIQVCGLSADIPTHANKAANAAAQLREFSAGWILDRYSEQPPPDSGWHWYSDDWRGQRGDMPTPEQVVETIAKRKTAVPLTQSQNGRPNSRAEEVAASYAAKRQEYFNG